MCDVMEDRRDLDAPRERLYDLIDRTPMLDWLLLTKRPQNFRRFLPGSWRREAPPNVWLLTTVEHQDYLWRIDELLKVPAVVHGISAEPLRGPLRIRKYLGPRKVNWVISGGESGSRARPHETDLFSSHRHQNKRAGVSIHHKKKGVFGETPTGLVRLGKHEAGRSLDGRIWDEFPVPNGTKSARNEIRS
jgi:protein gp37